MLPDLLYKTSKTLKRQFDEGIFQTHFTKKYICKTLNQNVSTSHATFYKRCHENAVCLGNIKVVEY